MNKRQIRAFYRRYLAAFNYEAPDFTKSRIYYMR